MITVKTPDGGTAQFPDGTPPEVIKGALAKKFPPKVPKQPAAPVAKNPDGTYGQAPEGFVLNPKTGQMEDLRSPNNPNINTGTATAAAQGLGQGVSFGSMDEVVGGMYGATGPGTFGQNYDYATGKMREELKRGREEHPVVSTGAEIGGALTVPVGALKTTGAPLLRIGKSAGITGALTAIYGAFSGEGGLSDRADNAVTQGMIGAGVGAIIPAAGTVVQKVLNNRAGSKAIASAAKNAPTTQELRTTGNALYQQIDDAGVQIKPEAFDSARARILDSLRTNTGFDELPGPGSLTPGTARVNQIMGEASAKMAAEPTAALPFKAVDQMRRQAGAAAGNVTNKTDQKAGMTVIEGLDDFVRNLGADDVVAGDVAALQEALPKAREVWARMTKSQMVDDAIEAGGNYLSGASSGIRLQFKRILNSDKLSRGFSAAERAAMQKVVSGSIPEQLLQLVGGGLGQLTQAGAGLAMGGPVGALAGAATAGVTRKAAEALTTRKAEVVRALMANGGLPQLPVASPRAAGITEKLIRRGTASASQPR
jgi:hypothetical protein